MWWAGLYSYRTSLEEGKKKSFEGQLINLPKVQDYEDKDNDERLLKDKSALSKKHYLKKNKQMDSNNAPHLSV